MSKNITKNRILDFTVFLQIQHQSPNLPDIILEDLRTYVSHEQILSGIIFRTSKGSPVDRINLSQKESMR